MMRLTISRTVPGDFTIFILIVVLPVFLAFVKKLGSVSSFPVTKQLDELALVLLLPFALLGLIKLAAKTHTLLYLIFFGAYLVISSISAYASNVSAYQYLTQFVLELKFPLMLAILVAIADKEMFLGWVIVFGQAVLLVCIPFLFWQNLAGESYDAAFFAGAHKAKLGVGDGFGLTRGAGIFWFPGQLAVFASFYLTYFTFKFLNTKSLTLFFWMAVSATNLMGALSKLEIFSAFFSILVAVLLTQNNRKRFLTIFMLIPGFLLVFYSLYPLLVYLVERYDIFNPQNAIVPRVIFYYNAVVLASDFFPLGAGLGTYAGHAASIFDSDIYMKLGFDQYSWYRRGEYMTDTFWPHIIGESGLFGFLFYFLCLLTLFACLLTTAKFEQQKSVYLVRAALGSLIFLYLNSLAAPNFFSMFDLFYGLFFLSMMGGFAKNNGLKNVKKYARKTSIKNW